MDMDTFLKEVALKQAVATGSVNVVKTAREFYRFLKDEHSGLDRVQLPGGESAE